MTYNFNLMN